MSSYSRDMVPCTRNDCQCTAYQGTIGSTWGAPMVCIECGHDIELHYGPPRPARDDNRNAVLLEAQTAVYDLSKDGPYLHVGTVMQALRALESR